MATTPRLTGGLTMGSGLGLTQQRVLDIFAVHSASGEALAVYDVAYRLRKSEASVRGAIKRLVDRGILTPVGEASTGAKTYRRTSA